ncbi:MAG: Uma2 family endonuclease [Elainella sp.]
MTLLLQCLEWLWRDRSDFYASGNLTVYYSPNQRRSEDLSPAETLRERGPDFFVVLGVERRPRKSWVVWGKDGEYPHVVVEILSESTAGTDRGLKKQIYQDTFRTIEYFWFDPNSLEFVGSELVAGQYQPKQSSEQGWFWSHQLQLFLGIQGRQLRFFTAAGELVPTPAEAALIEQQRADRAEQQQQAAETHSAKLAAKLRELGVDPETL